MVRISKRLSSFAFSFAFSSAAVFGLAAAASGQNAVPSGGQARPAGGGAVDAVTPVPRPATARNARSAGRGAGSSGGSQVSAQRQAPTADRPLLPIASMMNGLGIASGTPMRVVLQAAVDSGHARNGDVLDGTLAATVGGQPVGTPVQVTVVQVARAGSLSSYGELSLQLISVGKYNVLSDTVTLMGKEGPKELQDAAPGRGTEAVLPAGEAIVLPAA